MLISVSLFITPVSALENNQFINAQVLYGSCDAVDQTNGPKLIECLEAGRGGRGK